jgi:uncharacterized protein
MSMAWEAALADYVRPFVEDDPTGHDVYHCLRVKRLALRIAADSLQSESAAVLIATAYLHDVGRKREWQGEGDHVEIGMAAAQEILPGIGFPPDKVEAVVDCIRHHEEYRWAQSREGERLSPEVLVFQDADRLDAIGAVGLARMFCFGGAYRRPLWVPDERPGHWEHGDVGTSTYTHLYEKLFKLKETMNTAAGRALAEGRDAFMRQYADQFEGEWTGER